MAIQLKEINGIPYIAIENGKTLQILPDDFAEMKEMNIEQLKHFVSYVLVKKIKIGKKSKKSEEQEVWEEIKADIKSLYAAFHPTKKENETNGLRSGK